MPISNANFGVVALLDELHFQCRLFQRNFERLEDAADHWIKMERGEDFDRKVPPIDILAWCTVCLSAMAAIRRLVVAGPRDPVADRRRKALQSLLGNPSLTNVATPSVRNAWEHLDERLDRLLPKMQSGALSHLHVAATAPHNDTVALKRFDPVTMTIHFAGEGIPLRPAHTEIDLLYTRLEAAMVRLQSEIVLPWG